MTRFKNVRDGWIAQRTQLYIYRTDTSLPWERSLLCLKRIALDGRDRYVFLPFWRRSYGALRI